MLDELFHESDIPNRRLNNLHFIFHFHDFLQRLYGPYLPNVFYFCRDERIKDRKLATMALSSHPDSPVFGIPNPKTHTRVLAEPRQACEMLKEIMKKKPEGVTIVEMQSLLEQAIDAITPHWKLLGGQPSRFPD